MMLSLPRLRFPILFLVLGLVPCGSVAAEPTVAEVLQPFVEAGHLAGAVTLVATRDKVVSLEAVGFADVAGKVPLRTDALFWIASMSKPMTAVGLMMLVDEGKVKLDDPVEQYLPEFHGQWLAAYRDKDLVVLKHPARAATVRDLLRHTSGLPFKSSIEEPTLDGRTLRDGAISYGLTPLEFEPNTKYQYSNAGINTAGRIIEVVSGQAYEDFMDQRLFSPLGMKDTTFWPSEEQVKRLAKAYKPNQDKTALESTTVGQLRYPLSDRKRQPMPAGGLFSTAADVGTFCQMVLNGGTWEGKRYLSESAVRQMTSTQTGKLIDKDKGEQGYGLGWSTSRTSVGDTGPVIPATCGHGGAFATNMSIDPERQLVMVWMVQVANGYLGDGGKAQGAFTKRAIERFGAR